MKHRIVLLATLFVVAFCLFFSLAFAEVPFRVTKLIGDLNDTAESNKTARKELVEMRTQAVPGLVEESKKYKDLKADNLLSAARCLRVLREIAFKNEGVK